MLPLGWHLEQALRIFAAEVLALLICGSPFQHYWRGVKQAISIGT